METKDCTRIHKAFKSNLALLKRLAPMNDTLSELLTYVFETFPYDHVLDHLPETAQRFVFWTRIEKLSNLMEKHLYDVLCTLVNQGDDFIEKLPNRQALRVSAEVARLSNAARFEPKRWKKIELLAHAEWMLEAGKAYLRAHDQVEKAKALYHPYLREGEARMRKNKKMQNILATIKSAGEFGWNSIELSEKAYNMACDHQFDKVTTTIIMPTLSTLEMQPA